LSGITKVMDGITLHFVAVAVVVVVVDYKRI